MKFSEKKMQKTKKWFAAALFTLTASIAMAQRPGNVGSGDGDYFPGPSTDPVPAPTPTPNPQQGGTTAPAPQPAPRPQQAPKKEEAKTDLPPPDADRPLDGIVEDKMTMEKIVLPYEHTRQSDILWQKYVWRVIDVREKVNLPFLYPEEPFIEILLNGIKDSTMGLKAYSVENDKFHYKLKRDEVRSIGSSVDTIMIFDPVTYEPKPKPVYNKLNPEDVKRFRIKELWFFDKESSRMFVRILGMAPLKEEKDPSTGAFLFEKVLFWIYYPDCREYLARHRVFTDGNDASPLSWEDLFEQRRFSSYIYKESNVTNRRLQDIYSGVDILLEGEKIKQEIFNWEHDLWSY